MHGCLCLPGGGDRWSTLADAERAIFETSAGESAREPTDSRATKRTNERPLGRGKWAWQMSHGGKWADVFRFGKRQNRFLG